MSNNYLVGKNVTLFLDGGWEVSGIVEKQEDDKIIIQRDGELYLLFKDKVCLIKIEESKEDKPISKRLADQVNMDDQFPENGISYAETFLSIPRSLLGQDHLDDEDLSVSFKKSPNSNAIKFVVEDDI
jgi:hypothetical protein